MNDTSYIFLTKRVRIPKTDVQTVTPAPDGVGCIVVTSRGTSRVLEDYSSLARELYGVHIHADDEREGGAE